MKKTFSILFIVPFAIGNFAAAQSLQARVVNSGGNSTKVGNFTLEWNFGEMTSVQTLSSGNIVLTQGLLQPSMQLQAPLPVTWLYFKAKLVNYQTNLEWKVAQELNNDHFDIERSADGNEFSFLKKVNSLGNSSTPRTYSEVDPFPFNGVTYYRLKQVDIDGKFDYSNIVFVKKGSSITYKLFPNPVSDIMVLERYGEKSHPSVISITDATGKIVQTGSIGGSQQQINVSRLAEGTYFLKVESQGEKVILPFVKQ
jgi:hypothetical protein